QQVLKCFQKRCAYSFFSFKSHNRIRSSLPQFRFQRFQEISSALIIKFKCSITGYPKNCVFFDLLSHEKPIKKIPDYIFQQNKSCFLTWNLEQSRQQTWNRNNCQTRPITFMLRAQHYCEIQTEIT